MRRRKVRQQYEAAVRANRQLAVELQNQGMEEQAAIFAYQSQVLQRRLLLLGKRPKPGSWLFSQFLDILAGYGYKPGRTLFWYIVVVVGFAAAYFQLSLQPDTPLDARLTPVSALLFSISCFHGRGFFPSYDISFLHPITMLAACQAIIGLLIEISFIATFTKRYFGVR